MYTEFITSCISTGITGGVVVLLWLLNALIKKIKAKRKEDGTNDELKNIITFVLEAEKKLGAGQGKAKLNYVLKKINKEDNKKAIKKVNEVHETLKEAKKIIEENRKEKNA